MSKNIVFILALTGTLLLSSCGKEERKELATNLDHLFDHALDLTLTGDSNSIYDYVHCAGDIATTVDDIFDEDTEPQLK